MTAIFVSGPSGSGKTTLIENLIPLLIRRGLRVAAAKHDPHGHAKLDVPGKDSWRFAQAGAEVVDILGRDCRLSLTNTGAPADLSSQARECDIVLVEGFKEGQRDRIEVVPAGAKPVLEPGTFALVTDGGVNADLPTFQRHELEGIADCLLDRLRLLAPPVIVLSGGASRRMGRDKATIVLPGGSTMLERAINNARAVSSSVLVVSRDPAHEAIATACDARFLCDDGPQHPASGLIAALDGLTNVPGVISMPCDSPDIRSPVLRRLEDGLRQSADFACFAIGGRLRPLPGYFSRKTTSALRTIAEGGLPLHTLASEVPTLIISEHDARGLDSELASFRSINSPQDLRALQPDEPSTPGADPPEVC